MLNPLYGRAEFLSHARSVHAIRWDEKAGLRTGRGARSQVIDVLKAQEIKETGTRTRRQNAASMS